MTKPDYSREQSVNWLLTQQRPAGGWSGHTSPDAAGFREPAERSTPFFTSLILNAVGLFLPQPAVKLAADYLLAQAGPDWSWNYWEHHDRLRTTQPYPDDLDDTACALSALQVVRPDVLSGEVIGKVAKLLISAETAPGGPYRTWLVSDQSDELWQRVDPAVNANIGYFLWQQGVKVPGLESYITDQINNKQLSSDYYVGIIPTLYFLSRWYRGEAYGALKDYALHELVASETLNPILQAMLLKAAQRFDLPAKPVERLRGQLLAARQGSHWPAAALYKDPAIDAVDYYAGSAAMTTAFAIEALEFSGPSAPKASGRTSHRTVRQQEQRVIREALKQASTISQPDVRKRYRSFIKALTVNDQEAIITGLAPLTAQACDQKLSLSMSRALSLASLNGWVAYTIYDNFFDGEANPAMLGVANVALRRTVAEFIKALPSDISFHRQVLACLDTIDGANTWEVIHARARVRGANIIITKLPDYGHHEQLAERSAGHALAAHAVLLSLGHDWESHDQKALQQFFNHFLIARQLHDDAHDWEDDLRHGHLSAVVCRLLSEWRSLPMVISPAQDLAELRLQFWEKTIAGIIAAIQEHIAQAREALESISCFKDRSGYDKLLVRLERGAQNTLKQRKDSQDFIAAFGGST